MKKVVSLLLAAIMLFTLSACSGKKEDAKLLSDSLSVKLENVWLTYLEAENARQSAAMWAYDYVEAYCNEPCRDNYVRAVAATSAAADYIETLTVGECMLTQEDYNELLGLGYDLSYIASDYSSFAANAEGSALACRTMALDLMTEAYWEYGVEYMSRNVQVRKQISQSEINIAAGKTNGIMLVTGKDRYSDACYEKAPCIIKSETVFIGEQGKLDEQSNICLNEYEAAIGGFSELESIQNANIHILQNASQSGSFEEVSSHGIIWDELYAVLNLPIFTMKGISAVYFKDGAGECSIMPGDDLSFIEPVISVEFSDAPKQDFIDYILSIPVSSENYSVAGSLEGENDCYISYNDGVICFDALWKSSVLTVTVYDNVSVLCPSWYVYYKLT